MDRMNQISCQGPWQTEYNQCSDRLGIPDSKYQSNITQYGNELSVAIQL
jgi:hypothetical protein